MIGHNTESGAQLRSIVERVERLHEERKALSSDIAAVYAEAKGNGFDVKALKEVVKRRSIDGSKLSEHEAIVQSYEAALGIDHATRARTGADDGRD